MALSWKLALCHWFLILHYRDKEGNLRKISRPKSAGLELSYMASSGPLPKYFKSCPWCRNKLYVVFFIFHTEIKKEILKILLFPNSNGKSFHIIWHVASSMQILQIMALLWKWGCFGQKTQVSNLGPSLPFCLNLGWLFKGKQFISFSLR